MKTSEKTKRKNTEEKPKGYTSRQLTGGEALALALFAAVVMGVFIVVVIESAARF